MLLLGLTLSHFLRENRHKYREREIQIQKKNNPLLLLAADAPAWPYFRDSLPPHFYPHTDTHTADFTFSTIRFCVCMCMCTYLWISVCISLAMFLPPILLNQTHKRRSRITTTISTAHKTNLPPFPVLIFATCALESIQQVDRGRRRCRLFVTINQVGTKRVLQICTKRPLHHQHQAPRAAVHQSAKAPKHQSGPKSTLGISTSPAGTSTFVK